MAAIKDEKEDNKTGKMLALFDIMIHGHPLTKEQIATRFDVNARTANRYLAAIRQYLEEAEKEDGPRRELRYSREDRTYRIAEVENRFISKSELFAICKILLGGRTYSRKDLESLMNRLLQSAVLPEEQEEIKEFVKRELFDYLDPSHGKPDMDQLWEVAQAIKKHHVITFDYTKIGSAQGTPHRALPLGVVFSDTTSTSSPSHSATTINPIPPSTPGPTDWTACPTSKKQKSNGTSLTTNASEKASSRTRPSTCSPAPSST